MIKSESYKDADCCPHVDCSYSNDTEPCWGQVEFVDEDHWWDEATQDGNSVEYHACQGHLKICLNGEYIKET